MSGIDLHGLADRKSYLRVHRALKPQFRLGTNTFPALRTSGAFAARTKYSAKTLMVMQNIVKNALRGCTLGTSYVKNPVRSSTIELLRGREMVL